MSQNNLMNKRALSPLVATIILVAFSLVVGMITMSWGRNYVNTMGSTGTDENAGVQTGTITINYRDVDTGLKHLQIRHLTGDLSQEEYLNEEAKLLREQKT